MMLSPAERRFSMKCLPVYLLVFISACNLWSQTSAGTVSGTIRDRTSSVIPNAAVVLINSATNVRSATVSNEAGFYRLPGIAPGEYSLTADAAGMQKYEARIAVQAAQSEVIDAVLQPAGTVTTVEVQDVTPLVTTDNATVGAGMERK